jgi:hypothetical protein
MATIKPIYQSTLYAVIRFNGRYAVVLNSKLDAPCSTVQRSKIVLYRMDKE